MEDNIGLLQSAQELIDSLRPHMQDDGGDIKIMEVTEDNIVMVKWLGTCAVCSRAELTLKYGVKSFLMENIPEIKDVQQI